jgi:hypothetical protein
MHKIVITVMISAALIMSGISATTLSSGQLTSSVWAEDGGA